MTNLALQRAVRVKDAATEVLAFVWGASALGFSVLIMALFLRRS
jgi:hypothetical protein